MNIAEIARYGGTKEIIAALSSTGLHELYPPQALAIKAGLLRSNESFVISAPTASGKTLIAELAALKAYFEKQGKVIYTVPLRALAQEKFTELTKKYRNIGLKTVQTTGDFDTAAPWIRNADVIISTNEKVDSLMRHRAPWLRDVRLIIADEIHLLGDPGRGPTLEIVLARLRSENSAIRIIALSATIPNASEVAEWMKAKLIRSDWRPVPLREGVYYEDAAIFNDGTVSWIEKQSPDDVVNIALDTIRAGGQTLVFVNTRKAAESVAQKAASKIVHLQNPEERESIRQLSKEIAESSPEPTRVGNKIAELCAQGVSFHHAGILSAHRRLIEDAFRTNRLKLIAATTTLAMGLNLPSRRVIIRDWWRYASGQGMRPLPVLEIKQMSGRAGRPGFDQFGEAVLIARSKGDERYLFDHYIKGDLEDIVSQLANEQILRGHVLALIASSVVRNREDIADFFNRTFLAFAEGVSRLLAISGRILKFLLDEKLIKNETDFSATRFGRRISELYIDPLTGVILRDALSLKKPKSSFGLLHTVARSPDMMVLSLKRNDVDRLLELYYEKVDTLLLPEKEVHPTEELLGQIKTASLLSEWINEVSEDVLTAMFGVGPGDVHAAVELTDWVLYSASEVAKIFRFKDEERTISFLRLRVMYGVKEELLPLVTLKGIGRIRARNLFNTGYKTYDDIRKARAGELERVPAIGKKLAEDIKKQVEDSQAA